MLAVTLFLEHHPHQNRQVQQNSGANRRAMLPGIKQKVP